jgi:hypothetical protein
LVMWNEIGICPEKKSALEVIGESH